METPRGTWGEHRRERAAGQHRWAAPPPAERVTPRAPAAAWPSACGAGAGAQGVATVLVRILGSAAVPLPPSVFHCLLCSRSASLPPLPTPLPVGKAPAGRHTGQTAAGGATAAAAAAVAAVAAAAAAAAAAASARSDSRSGSRGGRSDSLWRRWQSEQRAGVRPSSHLTPPRSTACRSHRLPTARPGRLTHERKCADGESSGGRSRGSGAVDGRQPYWPGSVCGKGGTRCVVTAARPARAPPPRGGAHSRDGSGVQRRSAPPAAGVRPAISWCW